MELSFLIRILRHLEPEYLIDNAFDFTFHDNVIMAGNMLLTNLGIKNLENDHLILTTYGKIVEICLFYHSMFVFLFSKLNAHDDIDKINFINERFMAFQNTMSEQNYINLLNNADLNLFNQSIFQNIIELYKSYFDEFNFLLKFCRETSIVERNLFIFWNVLAFTRKLIRSFVNHQYLDNYHNNINYYDQILYYRSNKNNEAFQTISIFQYMQAHDEFEIKANKIMQTKLIHIKNFFQVKNIEFYHRNTKFVRRYLLPSLKIAETYSEGILYNSNFYPNKLHENYVEDNGEDIQIYMKLLFTQKFVGDTYLNEDQWNELRAGLIQNNQQLYVFYYKLNEEIQQKIEIIIKNYFFRKVFGFAPKYLPNNTVQMANVGVMNVPPHKYPELFVEIANHYGITIE